MCMSWDFFIILTTAAVLNAGGVTNIRSAAEAAEALRPLAGDLTFVLFALGIIGTGLLGSRCLPARLRIASPRRSAGPQRSRQKRRMRRVLLHHCRRHGGGTRARLYTN